MKGDSAMLINGLPPFVPVFEPTVKSEQPGFDPAREALKATQQGNVPGGFSANGPDPRDVKAATSSERSRERGKDKDKKKKREKNGEDVVELSSYCRGRGGR